VRRTGATPPKEVDDHRDGHYTLRGTSAEDDARIERLDPIFFNGHPDGPDRFPSLRQRCSSGLGSRVARLLCWLW